MRKTVIFGTGKIADVIHQQMLDSEEREVVAFTVDSSYKENDEFRGLPVVPFEELEQHYPPNDHVLFVAIGYQDLSRPRAKKIGEAKEKGYELPSFIHPQAGLPKSTEYGENCFIMDRALIHPRVRLGSDVFVWSGAMIGHHSGIGSHCWFTSCSNISGDVKVGDHCFFAVNATVVNSVTLGDACFVGANTLVSKDLADKSVVISEGSKPIKLDSDKFLKMSQFQSM